MLSFAGTNISNLSQDILGEIRFPHFDVITQRKVAAVLASTDAKIDCNSRINTQVEALIKTLYNYWFVQFDFPNVHGAPYRSSGGQMEYSTVLQRKIPIGWDATTLGDITPVSNESVTPSEHPDKEFRYFSIPVFDATHTYSKEYGRSIGSNKFVVRGSDLLISKLNPWFSRVVYVLGEEIRYAQLSLLCGMLARVSKELSLPDHYIATVYCVLHSVCNRNIQQP